MTYIGYIILEMFFANCTHPHGLKLWGVFCLSVCMLLLFFFFLILELVLKKRNRNATEWFKTDNSESRQRWQINTLLTFLLSWWHFLCWIIFSRFLFTLHFYVNNCVSSYKSNNNLTQEELEIIQEAPWWAHTHIYPHTITHHFS